MKIEDFKTLDVVDFKDGGTGIVYVNNSSALVVSQRDHSWCKIRETCDGFACGHGTITSVRRPGYSLVGNLCTASRAGKLDWLDPSSTVWSSKVVIDVKIGTTTAFVSDGKWTCEGAYGDLADAEKVMELFTEPDKPMLEAYDLVQIGEDKEMHAMIVPSPDPHEEKFVAVYGRVSSIRKWDSYGRFDFVYSTDEIPGVDINGILRWDNTNYAFQWFAGGRSQLFVAEEIWARKQMVRIATTWDARRIGDIVKIGCQEVTLVQVEELIRACRNTMPK